MKKGLWDKQIHHKSKCTIYQDINNVFTKVCKDMKYPSPSYGFYCPKTCTCKNEDVIYSQYQHPAMCEFSYASQEMICYYSDMPSELTDENKQWFPQVCVLKLKAYTCEYNVLLYYTTLLILFRSRWCLRNRRKVFCNYSTHILMYSEMHNYNAKFISK